MYKKFFGFKEKPFQLAPNPEYLFLSKNHGEALTQLIFTITHSEESMRVTGEKGTGKTTLCKAFFVNLDESNKTAYISTPDVDALQLLKAICEEFWIDSTPDDSKEEIIDKLSSFLIKKKAAGHKVIVLIDEAQNLSHDALEQIYLLSNLESNQEKLLQIILVGQPELNDMLSSEQFKQLGQRITKNCQLAPLNFLETIDYIKHRISYASQEKGPAFDKASCRAIYDYSKGVPLLINIGCEMALQNAFNSKSVKISGGITREAIKKLSQEKSGEPGSKSPQIQRLAILLAVIVPMVFAVLYFTKGQLPETTVSDDFVNKTEVSPSSEPIDPAVDKLEISEKTLAVSQNEPAEKSSENRGVYSVHVGSFKTASEANTVLNNLKSLGFRSFMYISSSKKGNTVYVVFAGKYQSYDLAKEASQSLSKKGHSNFVAKAKGSLWVPASAAPIDSQVDQQEIPEKTLAVSQSESGEKSSESSDVYAVHVGSFFTAPEAQQALSNMKSQGFPSFMYISLSKKGTTVYVVVAGKYQSYDLAKEASRILSEKGHSNFIARAKGSLRVPANAAPIDSPVDQLEIPGKTMAVSQSEPAEKSSGSSDVYAVHVGSFWTAPEANLALNNMKSLGFPSFMYISLSKKGNTVYVVVAGKYQSYDLAKEASEILSKKGHSNFIARAKGSLRVPANAAPIDSPVDKLEIPEKTMAVMQTEPGEKSTESSDVYAVHVGTFVTASQADTTLNELKSLGFPSFMYSKAGKKVDTVYVVVAGKYQSYDLAKEASRILSEKGHDNFITKAKNSLKEGPTK